MNQKLWAKVKDLTGTDEELKRLTEVRNKDLITVHEYWNIRAAWAANKSKLK